MEYWKDHWRFPNHEFSSYGRIRNKRTGHILKGVKDKDGYIIVSIGNVDNLRAHRLICEVFHGESIGERCQVNHIDSNRANNRADNLEWVTPSENSIHGCRYGYIDPMRGLRRATELSRKTVRIIETGQVFSSVKECAEYLGVPPTNVSRCLVGYRKGQRLHGYRLEFVDEEG